MSCVFTLPPYAAFNDDLIAGLLSRYGHSPELLARARIYVPSRRARLSLIEAFHQMGNNLFIPKIFSFGAFDEGLSDEAPLSVFERQLLLARFIQKEVEVFKTFDFSKILSLAQSLCDLFDECTIEDVAIEKIEDVYVFDEAQHKMHMHGLLKTLTQKWPDFLKQSARIDPAVYHKRMMDAEIKRIQEKFHSDIILVAGSTGSQKKTAEFMAFVSKLPHGAVILPGYDETLKKSDYEQFLNEPTHPFHGFAKLFERAGFEHSAVSLWHRGIYDEALQKRFLAARHAFTPHENIKNVKDVQGVYHFEAETVQDEAGSIAILLKHVLENPQKKAVVVTPDRELARRISAELKRFNIIIDDSSGIPLQETGRGLFIRLLLNMVQKDFMPSDVLAFLRHGLTKPLEDLYAFELYIREKGFHQPLKQLLLNQDFQGQSFYDAFHAFFKSFENFEHALHALSFENAFKALLDVLALWMKDDEQEPVFQAFCGKLQDFLKNQDFTFEKDDFEDILFHFMAFETVRETKGCHPRLALWGPLETRMQKADVMILAGLNEGVWPQDQRDHFLLSPQMRAHIGLTPKERRIGLSAHDFVQSFCAQEVYLTRALKKNGSPTLPSRFLVKLLHFLDGAHLNPSFDYGALYQSLSTPENVTPVTRPEPKPAKALRPIVFSVTSIEMLLKDPYSFYARHILKLKKIPSLFENREAQMMGDFFHQLLEIYYREKPSLDVLRKEACTLLQKYTFTFSHMMALKRKMTFILNDLKNHESGSAVLCEASGKWQFDEFTLLGRADRIDLNEDSVRIIDYKTGTPPPKTEVREGLASQLTLLALIAAKGGFGFEKKARYDFAYWQLKGKNANEAILETPFEDTAVFMEEAEAGLKNVLRAYANEEMPYYATPRPHKAPRFHDYAHLERLEEWMRFEDDE